MQNRYLFRGKRLDNGEWVIGGYLPPIKTGFDDGRGYIWENQFAAVCHNVDPSTIGQCTGLLAAKSYRGESEADRLIFEGDVLTASIYPFQDDEKLNYNAVVYWFEDTSQFGYELQCVNPSKRGISHGICEGFCEEDIKWEIIGNIHDNTED